MSSTVGALVKSGKYPGRRPSKQIGNRDGGRTRCSSHRRVRHHRELPEAAAARREQRPDPGGAWTVPLIGLVWMLRVGGHRELLPQALPRRRDRVQAGRDGVVERCGRGGRGVVHDVVRPVALLLRDPVRARHAPAAWSGASCGANWHTRCTGGTVPDPRGRGERAHVDSVATTLRREKWLGYHVVGALTPGRDRGPTPVSRTFPGPVWDGRAGGNGMEDLRRRRTGAGAAGRADDRGAEPGRHQREAAGRASGGGVAAGGRGASAGDPGDAVAEAVGGLHPGRWRCSSCSRR